MKTKTALWFCALMLTAGVILQAEQQWKTYQDSKIGFQISAPIGWKVIDELKSPVNPKLRFSLLGEDEKAKASIALRKHALAGMSFEQEVELARQVLGVGQATRVDNKKAYKFRLKKNSAAVFYMIEDGEFYWWLEFMVSPAKDWQLYKPIFDHVISDFRITEGSWRPKSK